MSIALKQQGLADHVIGVEAIPSHAQKSLELGLADEILPLKEAVQQAQLIILAVPVSAITHMAVEVLNLVDKQIVMDVGSTKEALVKAVEGHPKRGRLVATHPMWGTEYSGPEAAVKGAFRGKATVICNRKNSDEDALDFVEALYRKLEMHIVHMQAADHDVHVAYVSHISHITSFALANTVLEKEKEEDAIFELASGGFESTVRLAKSSPITWASIFMQNRENVLDVLNEHISQLRKFKSCLEKENYTYLEQLMSQANRIRRIIP